MSNSKNCRFVKKRNSWELHRYHYKGNKRRSKWINKWLHQDLLLFFLKNSRYHYFSPMRRAEFTLFFKNLNFVNRSKFYDSYFVLIRNIYKNALSVSYFVHIISFILRSHKTEYFWAQEVVIFFGIIFFIIWKETACFARSLARRRYFLGVTDIHTYTHTHIHTHTHKVRAD